MSLPTRGEEYTKIMEYLRKTQESCAMMAHLHRTEDTRKDRNIAQGWLAMSEMFKLVQHKVIELAKGNLQ